MWPTRDEDRALFPLRTIGAIRKLFETHLRGPEPNLALLSIVCGFVENTLTRTSAMLTDPPVCDAAEVQDDDDGCDLTHVNLPIRPHVEFDLVDTLMAKFDSTILGFCDPQLLASARVGNSPESVRKLVKHVADIVWNTLSKSQYKDRPHLQSIYSYLTGNKLDCFGVAFAVVAACQLLEVNEVHLALSEDHAWVVFGEDGDHTAEVTWHGKGNEDKRGKPVEVSKVRTSWLYMAGRPVRCSRYTEVASMVSSINCAINSNTDSIEVGALQQELLWLLYDNDHLKTYPMAIDNLGDLEEISPSLGRPLCSKLFEEAIEVNKAVYNNHHVYPYTYQGGYYYRQKEYKKALKSWAHAAMVMKLYNYSKDDEEIYKEFMEIAGDLIPHVLKSQSQSDADSILNDPDCYRSLIEFYDGLCCWEEGSPTPIMHVGWSKPMVSSMSKFSPEIRLKLIKEEVEEGKMLESCFKSPNSTMSVANLSPNSSINSLSSPGSSLALTPTRFPDENECFQNLNHVESPVPDPATQASRASQKNENKDECDIDDCAHQWRGDGSCDMKLRKGNSGKCAKNNDVIEVLSDYSSRRLLNVEYLLGLSTEPFDSKSSPLDHYSKKPMVRYPTSPSSGEENRLYIDINPFYPDLIVSESQKSGVVPEPLVLHSAKMRGLQGLLGSEKLNTSAIQLQLTAQSHALEESRPKRARREQQ